MRQDVYEWIKENEDQLKYLRLQPIWYRRLMRNPRDFEKMSTEAVYHFEKSVPQRVNKFSDGIQVANMMLGMLQAMNLKAE